MWQTEVGGGRMGGVGVEWGVGTVVLRDTSNTTHDTADDTSPHVHI